MSEANSLQSLLQCKWNQGLSWRAFVDYSQKNVEEMRSRFANAEIPDAIRERVKAGPREVRILVIGADWCADVLANAPVIARLAEASPNLDLRIVDRDRHEDLTNHFLTNGAKAVPKAIIATPDFSRFELWGPRPAPAQAIMTENKGKMPKEDILPMIHQWYADDAGRALLDEFAGKIEALGRSL